MARTRVEMNIGMSGSGKSRELQEQTNDALDDGERCVAIDTTGEAAREEWWPDAQIVSTIPELAKGLHRGEELLLFVPARDRQLGPPRRDELPSIEHIAALCLDARDVTLVITEAHMHIGEGAPMGRQVRTLLTQYRHYDCAVLADTQRFAAVAKPLVSQATALRLFAMAGARDLGVVADIGGNPLVAAVQECARRLAAGEPGWHVVIDARHPPIRPKIVRRDLDDE